MRRRTWRRLPDPAVTESIKAYASAPFAVAVMRMWSARQVTMSDATQTGGGVVESTGIAPTSIQHVHRLEAGVTAHSGDGLALSAVFAGRGGQHRSVEWLGASIAFSAQSGGSHGYEES